MEPIKPKYEFKLEELKDNQFRWIIPKHKSLILIIKFFTKVTGNFEGRLDFEAFSSLKKYNVTLKGISDFPSISTFPQNIYWTVKKSRPLTAPESYLSKVYVSSEKIFEFGPLLIGKNPDKRQEPQIKRVNSISFKLSNSGKFDDKI